MSHTPGPWKVTYGEFTEKGVKYEINMTDQRLTAFDARLIAAAPDLKEALEDCLAFIAKNDPWDDYECGLLKEQVRAALAKCEPGAES